MPTIQLRAWMPLQFATGPGDLQVDLTFETGSLTGLYGPSGSGKTTLLRILAGLATPQAGFLSVDGEVWLDTERRIDRPAQQRRVGMVFQDAALFPNMTVLENVRYATENKRDDMVDELLELAGLQGLAGRKPATLSGGQRQRVALIRALARRPGLLLLDEPFSALDRETRQQLLADLVRLHRRFGTTTLLVSHQQEEIFRTADRLVEMEQGRVRFNGTPTSLPGRSDQAVSGTIVGMHTGKEGSEVTIGLDGTTVVIKAETPPAHWREGEKLSVWTEKKREE
uniref:sulfate/molybdate ABC transporter ATP-binding protein n=1 Tax=Larkinella soli TaxID=1770527 RepID=UPI000FFB3B73|nr:ATP-binding cassette domain-containing protein [Larkinella soli]